MGLILNIETTTTNCSVALAQNGQLLALKEHSSKNYSHSEELHLFIKEVLEESEVKAQDLDAVAVSKGPGSYTGLRIGVSAAKGICFATDTPLLAIDTLESLALQAPKEDFDFVIPLLDARRMEVYTAVFSHGKKMGKTEAKVLDPDSYRQLRKKGQLFFIGNGVEKLQELIGQGTGIRFQEALPSSREMVGLSYSKFLTKDFENLAYFEPYYLKDFIAVKPKSSC